MALKIHPEIGTIVLCDFYGFVEPEMTKRRPAIVVSPRFRQRDNLCTIVPLSTTTPKNVMPYHCVLEFDPPLPRPYREPRMWAKCDMLSTISFNRLALPFSGKDSFGKRIYDIRVINALEMKMVRECILHALNLSELTTHL
jgi:mRNA interferase MazF